MPGTHAKLPPSGSKRWISCPGSVALSAKMPTPPSSPYAMQGTAAHWLGEQCLARQMFTVSEFIAKHPDFADENGDKIEGGNTITVLDNGKPYSFPVDDDMADAVDEYLAHIKIFYEVGYEYWVEHRFHLTLFGFEDIYGTADCVAISTEFRTIRVVDYKHGRGVAVDAYRNSQLMIYALGAIQAMLRQHPDLDLPSWDLHVTIVQPRANHVDGPIRTWSTTVGGLLAWAQGVLRPAVHATREDHAALVAGDHCRWCPAMAVCPTLVEQSSKLAQVQFADPVLPDPADLTGDQIAQLLEWGGMLKVAVEQIAAYAAHQAKQGMDIPGYKLVRSTTRRKWVDANNASEVLQEYLGDDVFKSSIVTPAQAEKLLKKAGVSPDLILTDLWEKPESHLTLAPLSDKRKAVDPPLLSVFTDDPFDL